MESMNHSDNRGQEHKMPAHRRTPADLMATISVITGAAGIVLCLSPLIQFPLGVAAVTFSYLAKQHGKRSLETAVGMITGIISIILSLIMFASTVYVYQVVLNDPVLGPMYNDMYQQIMGYFGQTV